MCLTQAEGWLALQQKGSHALSPAQVGQLESLAPPFLKGNASLRTILGGEDRREVRLGVPLSNAVCTFKTFGLVLPARSQLGIVCLQPLS